MKKKECYIYTRVSTSMQVDGYSLDAQKDKLRKYADFQDMVIVGEYSDEGKSGKSVEGRPEFLQMLRDIEEGKDHVSFVLVFKLSRFGRNAADVLTSLQKMQDFGVNLICVEDGIDSSKDSGKLMISVLSAVAEIERENILVQTMEGRRQKAREGKWNGGFAPYGYKLVDGELEIAEDEAEIIRLIFDKYINTTMGVNGIAAWLNQQGYQKKKRQNNTLNAFAASFIKGVLDNPVYCGKLAYGRRKNEKIPGKRNAYHIVKQDSYMLYDGIHEAIVSEEIWNTAHDRRLRTGVKREKTYSLEHEHLLSGILCCPICGAGMYGNVNRKKKKDGSRYKDYFYYTCKHRRSVDGHVCTYKKQWGEDKVNAAVAEVIKKLVQNPKFEAAIRQKINTRIDTGELEQEIENLRKQLRQVLGAKNKLAQQMDSLDVTDRYYDRKYQDMQDRLDHFYDQIDEIEDSIAQVEVRIQNIRQQKLGSDNVYQYLLYFDKLYDKFTDAEKKEFLSSFVERVDIYEDELPDGRFLRHIKFKFPVFYNGQEIDEMSWDKGSTVETVVLLTERPLVLVEPCGKYLESYLEAREEGRENGMASDDFSSAPAGELLKRYDDFRCGRDLPPGWVAADYYWLVDEDKNRFIGEIGIRHGLTEALRRYGGHIGYAVRPSEWNKGHGTLMLGLALEKARDLGITTAMITCDDDNAASARVMEKNGFTLLDRVTNTVDGRTVITRRYTKNLSPGPAGKGAV